MNSEDYVIGGMALVGASEYTGVTNFTGMGGMASNNSGTQDILSQIPAETANNLSPDLLSLLANSKSAGDTILDISRSPQQALTDGLKSGAKTEVDKLVEQFNEQTGNTDLTNASSDNGSTYNQQFEKLIDTGLNSGGKTVGGAPFEVATGIATGFVNSGTEAFANARQRGRENNQGYYKYSEDGDSLLQDLISGDKNNPVDNWVSDTFGGSSISSSSSSSNSSWSRNPPSLSDSGPVNLSGGNSTSSGSSSSSNNSGSSGGSIGDTISNTVDSVVDSAKSAVSGIFG